ncbi:fumarylacetoacetate hydrolase family protein [Niabella yanshanensis]|uniref:Fumarylacetoacetate hydrolase family protein n=1 Tax=Niabella yanshanensis TaxID=577386 RepID=A0ABZ0W9I7_9BACT|nr:fumarylacetoacetate hydrolase family protein [Niabella yanshanensis]WQD38741.1 fumarylacetoacetate hydrolase family protein [Niabella yanshanensis]
MKLYRTSRGPVVEKNNAFYLLAEDWLSLVNNDSVIAHINTLIASVPGSGSALLADVLAPITPKQELWACGVTYLRSKVGRQEESKDSGGSDFYAKVYEAERPEVFFKATYHRIAGDQGKVRIRKDSEWDVPEPELTLVVASSGKIIGYTIGNDMSSRSIEGENPLYLPQAKTYDGCAALGPCIYLTNEILPADLTIRLCIIRDNAVVFDEMIAIGQMKRKIDELVSFVYKECSFPAGCLIMTGTGIVPPNSFTLQEGDEIRISIREIGTLTNWVSG